MTWNRLESAGDVAHEAYVSALPGWVGYGRQKRYYGIRGGRFHAAWDIGS